MPPNIYEIKSEIEKRLNKIENTLWGANNDNGLNGKVKEIEDYIDNLKPQLIDLNRIYASIQDIKKNLIRVFWVIVISSILALGSRFIQIKIEDQYLKDAELTRLEERQENIKKSDKNFNLFEMLKEPTKDIE